MKNMQEISIALVTPSSPFEQEKYNLANSRAREFGFKIIKPSFIRSHTPSFINGSAHERMQELHEAQLSGAQAIWCTRGGVGAMSLWQDYKLKSHPTNNSPLIGYSDTTALHMMRYYHARVIGIHGPGFLDLAQAELGDCDILRLLLTKQEHLINYPELRLLTQAATNITGELLPMNLSTLISLQGLIKPDFFANKILALEDINEQHYKIFSMIEHLRNNHVFDKLTGLLVGHLSHDRQDILTQTLVPLGQKYNFPVFDWPIFGHDRPNYFLLFGAQVKIILQNQSWAKLTYA